MLEIGRLKLLVMTRYTDLAKEGQETRSLEERSSRN